MSVGITQNWTIGLGIAVVAVGVVGSAWLPTQLQVMWEHADMLLPALIILGLCIYVGFPLKHRRLPNMDSVVFSVSGGLAIVKSGRQLVTLWVDAKRTDDEVFAALVFLVAAVGALTRAFQTADQQNEPPQAN